MRTLFLGFLFAAVASCSAVPKSEQETVTNVVVERSRAGSVTLEEALRVGCRTENPDACFWVAKEALKDSPELYREGMEKACKAGSKVACSARHNIAIDAKLPDYQTSCDSGDPWAASKRGLCSTAAKNA